jgi:hypothetical protein
LLIWNLFGPILRSGVACNLLFPVYPDLDRYRVLFDNIVPENEGVGCQGKEVLDTET